MSITNLKLGMHAWLKGLRHCCSGGWVLGCLLAVGCGAAPGSVDDRVDNGKVTWQEQGPGVAYLRDYNPRKPLTVHVIRIDRSVQDLELHTTLGGRDRIGMAVVSHQVKFIPPETGKAVAAINGDYYYDRRPLVGDPRTLLIRRGGELVSAPGEDRVFFFLDADGQPHLTNVVHAFRVTFPDGRKIRVGLNEAPRGPDQAALFTSAAGASSRMSDLELVLVPVSKNARLPLQLGEELTVKVVEINPEGRSSISTNSLVLSLPPRAGQLPSLTEDMELKISLHTIPSLEGATLALGGGPSLVRGGKTRDTREIRGFQVRNPRSAFGWNDRYYYFVQADGRQPRHSMGMTLPELADYFVKLGCESALNLDGGGSCTTWLGGKVINRPSEGRERPSATALVLVRKNSSGK